MLANSLPRSTLPNRVLEKAPRFQTPLYHLQNNTHQRQSPPDAWSPGQLRRYFIASSSNVFARSSVFMSFDMPARRILFSAALT